MKLFFPTAPRRPRNTRNHAGIVFLLACGLLAGGCETNSAEQRIEIRPASAILRVGQSQTFTVSGGYEYTWALDPEDGRATLNRRQGDTVVFTLLSSPASTNGEPSVIAVICTSILLGTGNGAATNSYTATDTAYVHVRP